MKRLLLSCVVLATALYASVASAQLAGLKLAYDDCGGASAQTWTCTTNSGVAFTAVASVVIGPALTTLTGEEGVVEIAFQNPVPDWWKVGAGQCRAGTAVNVAFLATGSCVDYFGPVGAGPSGGSFYTIGPGSDPKGPVDDKRVRVRTVSAVDINAALLTPPPVPGDEVFMFTVSVNKSRSTGTGSCAGCAEKTCAMLKLVRLTQPAGVGDFDYNDVAVGGNLVLAGQDLALDCYGVPTNTRTWGQIKSLYR